MATRFLGFAAALLLAGTPLAFAVSDGNYDPAKQHCTGDVDNSDAPTRTELHCYSFILTVRDGNATQYHEYFGIGLQQQPDTGKNPLIDLNPAPLSIGKKQDVDVWYDPAGNGTDPKSCQLYRFSFDAGNPQPPSPPAPVDCNFIAGGSNAAPNPGAGLHLYLGADDNTDAGEHDSSNFVNNGPSDGGSTVLNLDPASLMTWMARAMAQDVPGLLTHPLPLVDGGIGACADGFCMSVQTTKRDQAYAGGTAPPSGNGQDVANYQGRQWDPYNCAGPTDGTADCGGHTLDYWNNLNGDPAMEPGVQIYEDPDAQGSPAGPVYPIPALYVGTCGVIIGGGALSTDGGAPQNQSLGFPPTPAPAPGAPYVNDAGQFVIPTDCHGEQTGLP